MLSYVQFISFIIYSLGPSSFVPIFPSWIYSVKNKMQWRRPRFWLDNFRGFNYTLVFSLRKNCASFAYPVQTWQERRNLVLDRLESSGFGWWIVFVAGLGFLTDAYDVSIKLQHVVQEHQLKTSV